MVDKSGIKKTLIFRVQFLLISLIILIYTSTVFAQSNYTVFDSQQNISADKTWNIKFSDNIDKNSVTSENVRIIDENGTPIKLSLSCNQNIISVKPLNNYISGKTYNIYVDNIKGLDGSGLKNPGTMKFTIQNGVQPILNSNAYSLIDTHTYKIIDTITFTSDKDTDLSTTYNIGSLSNSPYQKELDLKVNGENAKITTENSNNEKLTAETHLNSGQQLQYQITRTIQTSGIHYKTDLSKTSGNYSSFSDYSKYTAAADKIESDNQAIIDKSKELFNGISNPYYKAKKAYEFVNSYMNYDENIKNKGALSALQTSKGVCEDYSELFAALLRASGVPARVVTGFWTFNDSFNNNIASGDKSRHAWAEYYLPEYGWIAVEPTNVLYKGSNRVVDFSYFSNIDSSDHLIIGYDAAGENKDTNIYYNYFEGSGVKAHIQTQVELVK